MVNLQVLLLIFISLSKGHCLATNPNYSYISQVITSTKDDSSMTSIYHVFDNNNSNNIVKATNEREKQMIYKESLKVIRNMKNVVKTTFLPIGYPQKTPKGYLSYSIWSWIQDLSTQLRAVLATQRILEGVGVGREGATALSASLNFILRDGCGMISTLLFTALVSSKFRTDVKRWRIVADIMNDVGITFEVAATLVPRHFFLPMICELVVNFPFLSICHVISIALPNLYFSTCTKILKGFGNMCKAVCGVAAGACNGAINLHWAKGSDISDINAKFGAQHTVTGGLGLLFAAIFARSVSSLPSMAQWLLYTSLTFLHIFANLKCMRLIQFDYLNTVRMDLMVNDFLTKVNVYDPPVEFDDPLLLSKREPLLFKPFTFLNRQSLPIRMGVSFEDIAQILPLYGNVETKTFINNMIDQMEQDRFIVLCSLNEVVIGTCPSIDPILKAKAYFYACVMRKTMLELNTTRKFDSKVDESPFLHHVYNIQPIRQEVDQLWSVFVHSTLCAGWNLEKTELASEGFSIEIQSNGSTSHESNSSIL